jgi:hypothetical protein
MLEFFRDGGWGMFLILAFGAILLATAAYYAVRPDERHEGFLEWMSRAVLWATLVGVASDVGTVFKVTCHIEDDSERSRTIVEGLAESMSPVIMGFAFLTLAAFLTAIGRRRFDARKA